MTKHPQSIRTAFELGFETYYDSPEPFPSPEWRAWAIGRYLRGLPVLDAQLIDADGDALIIKDHDGYLVRCSFIGAPLEHDHRISLVVLDKH